MCSGWSTCPSPNPEFVAYLSGVQDTRTAKKKQSGRKESGTDAPKKRVRDEDAASDGSADTAQQGTDGVPLSPPATRKKRAANPLPTISERRTVITVASDERTKMTAGMLYNAGDVGLVEDRARARDLLLGEPTTARLLSLQ